MRTAARALLALVVLAGSIAEAKHVKYAGVHPRTGKPGGGVCYIEAPHVHSMPPANEVLYRQHDGIWLFVGDPVPFGYDGPKEKYYGPHPVTVDVLVGSGDDTFFCYLDGPHWHPFAPPSRYNWEEKEEVHYYAGAYPPEYERERPRYVAMNVVYQPIAYERPVVVGPPPPAYVGPILDVRVHLPSVGVVMGAPPPPGVVVVEERPHKPKKVKAKKWFKGGD